MKHTALLWLTLDVMSYRGDPIAYDIRPLIDPLNSYYQSNPNVRMGRANTLFRDIIMSRVTLGIFLGLWAIFIVGWFTGPIQPEPILVLFDLFAKLLFIPGAVILSTISEAYLRSLPGLVLALSITYFIIAIAVSALVYIGKSRFDFGGPRNKPSQT